MVIPILIHGLRRIILFKVTEQLQVIKQRLHCLIEPFLCFLLWIRPCLRLHLLPSLRCIFRLSNLDSKINCQLLGCILLAKPKQLGGEVNHIAISLAAKAVKPLVYLHARGLIFMKRTASHAISPDLYTVQLSSLPRGYIVLDGFKYVQFILLSEGHRHERHPSLQTKRHSVFDPLRMRQGAYVKVPYPVFLISFPTLARWPFSVALLMPPGRICVSPVLPFSAE